MLGPTCWTDALAHWTTIDDGDPALVGPRRPIVDASKYILLAHSVAIRYVERHPQYSTREDDLHGEAMVGLVRATHCFNRSRGCKFITYAWWSIWNTLNNMSYLDRMPKRTCPTRLVSIDAPVTADGQSGREIVPGREPDPIDAILDAEENRLASRRLQRLRARIAKLDDDSRALVRMKFFDGATYAELQKRFMVTKQTVYGRIVAALRKLGYRGKRIPLVLQKRAGRRVRKCA